MKSTRLTGLLALFTLAAVPVHAAELQAPSSTYATIVEASNAAANGDIIIVTADHSLASNALGRDRNLTFTSGASDIWRTITAFNNQRAFTMTEGHSLTLENIILQGTGANSGDAAAIGFTGTPPANPVTTIAGSFTIQGFTARSAAIMSSAANATMNIGSAGGMVTFRSNKTTAGNAAALRMSGAGSTLVIRGASLFENNHAVAPNGGGAINVVNMLLFEDDTVFRGNSVTGTGATSVVFGGAIYNNNNSGTVTFAGNATFADNQTSHGHGGAMRSNAIVIAHGALVLTGNTAQKLAADEVSGGAFYLPNGLDSRTAITATANSAADHGGALYSSQNMTFTGVNLFASNTAVAGQGGAIYAQQLVSLSGASEFSGNVSGQGGGAIATRGDITINGGASFINNIASTGHGGALLLTFSNTNTKTSKTFRFNATTGDITFQGNTAASSANAIYFDQASLENITATLNLDADEGRSINFLDPIASALDTIPAAGAYTNKIIVNKTGAGTVLFDTHTSDISADTLVSAGTFALGRQATYGSVSPNTTFTLGGAAVLAGSGTVRAGSITLETGATLRAAAGQTLTLRAATGNQYSNRVHLAGAGIIDAGPGGTLTAGLVTIGDSALAVSETLSITGNLTLSNATLNYGLNAAGIDSLLVGGTLSLTGTNTFNFSEFINGTYTLIDSGASIINNSSNFKTTIGGIELVTGGRSSATYSINNDLLEVILSKQNAARTWNGASSNQWNDTGGNWTEGDQLFADGDSVIFSPAATSAITVAAGGVIASDILVDSAADITFSGGRIKTDASSWQRIPPATTPAGKLIKDGAGTLTLANDSANEFTGGVTINQGIVSIANAGQLGAALGKIEFAATTAADNARIAITGDARFDSAPAGESQSLTIGTGKHGGFIVRQNASLTIASATGAINIADGGAFYLDVETGGSAAFTGNTAAAGKGGFMHLGANATASIDIAGDAGFVIGQADNAATDTITSADATAAITKTGAGALRIHSNNSAYTGATRITEGSLILDGPNARLGGAVTIAAGALLSGNGALTGSATLDSGAVLQVGELGATGTITTGALFLNGATLDYDLGDLIITNTLALYGTNAFRFATFDTVGTHQLISAGSITGFDAASIKTWLQKGAAYIEVGAPGSRYTITYQTNASGLLMNLAIANTALTWSGATGNQWGADGNWIGSDTAFAAGDIVTFNSIADAGNEASRNITIAPAGVIVAGMTVAGSGTYRFTGGAITGVTGSTLTSIANPTGQLEKIGPGLLILDNAENKFANGIAVRSGILQSNPASLGANTITLDTAGTLILDLAAPGTYAGAVSGPGTVIKQGAGTLAIAAGKTIAAATFVQREGDIDLDAGTITAANYELRAGRLMLRGGAVNTTSVFTLDTDGTLLGAGSITAASLVHKGALRIGKASGLTDSHATLTIQGNYSGAGGVIVLNTVLNEGGVHTQSDQLMITGNATGNARVSIINDGGIGEDTVGGGIKVVGIGGANDIDLTLADRVVVDVYDYALLKQPDGFYLSAAAPSPEIPAAGSLTAAAMFMGNASLDNLMTRLGEIRASPEQSNNIWLTIGYHGDKIDSSFNEGVKVKTSVLQAGYDFARSRAGGDARWNLGIYFSRIEGDADHDTNVSIENKACGGGLYLLYANRGFHLDAAIKAENNSYSVNTPAGDGRLFDHMTSKGWNLAGTVEAGYAISLGKMGFLEPQAQFTWQRFETAPATD